MGGEKNTDPGGTFLVWVDCGLHKMSGHHIHRFRSAFAWPVLSTVNPIFTGSVFSLLE
jgi:hypothetical protein